MKTQNSSTKGTEPQTNQAVSPSNSRKNLFVFGVGIVTLFVLLLLTFAISAFAGNSEQTYLSMFLDATGNHELAVKADLAVNAEKRENVAFLSQESENYCTNEWREGTLNTNPIWATSGNINLDIRPINEKYNQSTYFSYDFGFNVNLREEIASAHLEVSSKADLITLREGLQAEAEANSSESPETQNINDQIVLTQSTDTILCSDGECPLMDEDSFADDEFNDLESDIIDDFETDFIENIPNEAAVSASVKAIATPDRGYVTVDNISFATDTFSSQNGLTKWYAQDWDLNDSQKDGISEVIDAAEETLALDPYNVVSADIGNRILEEVCGNISNVQIGGIETVSQTIGDNTIEFRARKAEFTTTIQENNDSQEVFNQLYRDILDDETFRNFLVNQYPLAEKYNTGFEKIAEESNPDFPGKDDWEARVDEFLNEQKKQLEEQEDMNEADAESSLENDGTGSLDEMLILSPITNQIYFDPTDMTIQANRQSVTVTFTDKAFEGFEFMRPYLEDGILISSMAYDLERNESVPAIELPADADVREFEAIEEDLDLEGIQEDVTGEFGI